MKAAFTTLGCKVNQYETQILEQEFAKAGFEITDIDSEADVYVVNSCTVTGTGDKKSRQSVRHLRRAHPNAVIALTGCFPQAFPSEASLLMEADVITGTSDRASLLPLVMDALNGKRVVYIKPHCENEEFEPMHAEGMLERTRAFVKIEDGCDNFCSYCVIPKARGPVRSKPLTDLGRELEHLASKGFSEVVLAGVNLPFYGRDLGVGLVDAVELASQIFPRVRLSSLEPELIKADDIERLAKLPSFCPQFHLVLQSGCDKTLANMRRRYNTTMYKNVADNIRAVFDNPAFTTDVIVGFPGETEEDFLISRDFVSQMGYLKTHVFVYSRREGTDAALMPGHVSNAEKSRRGAEMSATAGVIREAFLKKMVGRTESVLIESEIKDGMMEGFTPNYTPVRIPAVKSLLGKCWDVKIVSATNDYCIGEIKNPPVGYDSEKMF